MKTRWLRLKWLLLFGLAAFLILPATGLTQFGPGGGGWGGGRGGFSRDPNERWMQYTGGKPVWRRSEITDPMQLQSFDRVAGRLGITTGEITREQYIASSMQRMQQFGGGFGGPPGGVAPPGGSPAPGGAASGGPGGGGPGPNVDAMAETFFQRLDKNGDGLLNYDEMPEELKAERDKWDENKDGFIDLKEFKAYLQARVQQWQAQRAQAGGDGLAGFVAAPAPVEEEDAPKAVAYRAGKLPPNMPAWFTQLDTDHDGQIGLYEWKAGGRPIEEFERMDLNNDGFLTPHEVMRALGLDKQVAATGAGAPGGDGTSPGAAGGPPNGGAPSGPPGSTPGFFGRPGGRGFGSPGGGGWGGRGGRRGGG
jgi:hypothetical protein